jgi:hypothetical protein
VRSERRGALNYSTSILPQASRATQSHGPVQAMRAPQ